MQLLSSDDKMPPGRGDSDFLGLQDIWEADGAIEICRTT
jgi:hypothetical protein